MPLRLPHQLYQRILYKPSRTPKPTCQLLQSHNYNYNYAYDHKQNHIPNTNTFHTSLTYLKKGAKQSKELARAASAAQSTHTSSSSTSPSASSITTDDPQDFTLLNSSIERALTFLKSDCVKLRTGGRFNPEILEGLRVAVDVSGVGGGSGSVAGKGKGKSATGSGSGSGMVRLGELAQVVPKGGRSIMLLVGEKEHIKPIISAIQSSPTLQLQPVPDPTNPSQLNIAIPPPTKESRDAAIANVGKAGETAGGSIRKARAVMQKTLRGMELKKSVRPDELKKAGKEMEKIVEAAGVEVKKIVEAAKKGMEQS